MKFYHVLFAHGDSESCDPCCSILRAIFCERMTANSNLSWFLVGLFGYHDRLYRKLVTVEYISHNALLVWCMSIIDRRKMMWEERGFYVMFIAHSRLPSCIIDCPSSSSMWAVLLGYSNRSVEVSWEAII